MENIKTWGLLLVYVSAGCLIYFVLLPESSVSKTARGILGLIVMSVVSAPLISGISEIKNHNFSFSEAPAMASPENLIKEAAEKEILSIVSSAIEKNTDIPYECEIYIDIDSASDINIERITIVFRERPEALREIKEALYNGLSIMPEIKTERDNE